MRSNLPFPLCLPINNKEHNSLNPNDKTKYSKICYDSVYGKPYIQMISDNLEERKNELKNLSYAIKLAERNLEELKIKEEYIIEDVIESENEFEDVMENYKEEIETIDKISQLYLKNKSIKEISEELGIEQKNVKFCLNIYLAGNF